MSKKWGTVADWAKVALSVVGTLGALASYKLLPERYNWVWPILALVALAGVALVIARLASAKGSPGEQPTRRAEARGDRSVAIAGDVKDSPIITGDVKGKGKS